MLPAALLPAFMAGGLGGSPLHQHHCKLPTGEKPRHPHLGERTMGTSPSHCGAAGCSKQREHLGDQGMQLHPGVGLMCQDPAQSQHQPKTGQQASSDGQTCPSWCLVLGQEGAGQPRGAGGWRYPSRPYTCPAWAPRTAYALPFG